MPRVPVLALVVLVLIVPGHAATGAPGSGDLGAVLAKFDGVQGGVRSLSAEFTKTTLSPLMKEPIVSKGQLYLSKPSSVLWEFTSPEPMRFVIHGNEYVGYFPQRKRAERKDIHRWSEQIFRFLGVGQSSSELRKFYDIALGRPGTDMKGTYVLVLEPRKRRVRKRLDDVRLWVDADTHLPVKFSYHGSAGQLETVTFRNVRVNPDLSASLFKMDLPSDVTVTSGFSGLGMSGPASPGRR